MQLVIVAGGAGTRLWPVSTETNPKQFSTLIGDKSSAEHVFEYASEILPAQNIWINTGKNYEHFITEIFPTFQKDRILLEPERRDTFAAIGSMAAIISGIYGEDEPILFSTADEFMFEDRSIKIFQKALLKIGNSLENGDFNVITMGIKPSYPATIYGYIEIPKDSVDSCFDQVVDVLQYREKPNFATAEQFVSSGNFLWHKNNPSFTFRALREFLEINDPESLNILLEFQKSGEIDNELYSKLPKISMEFKFMEKAQKMGVIGLDFKDWVDVGTWENAFKHLPDLDSNQNQIQVLGDGNKVKLADPNRKVAFVGVSDLLVVENEEGLLIIDPRFSSEVKKVAGSFK
jgi:mannose-1-phosphate guanylyltransferase